MRAHFGKGFDEGWSATAAARLAALEPHGAKRTGAAQRHATAALRRVHAEHKVLILLSDGYPQDSDHGDAPSDRPHALHDTAHTLRRAERASVTPFCLAIDAAAHDYMRSLCPPRRYRVIDVAHMLADCLGEVCAGLKARTHAARR